MISFEQLSFWEQQSYLENIDYLIIGSGIVGLSTAIHLKEAAPQKKVVVLERGYLPTGASTKNAGFACLGSPSEILADLKSLDSKINRLKEEEPGHRTSDFGLENVWKTFQKRWEGLNYLRQMLGDEAIGYEEAGSYEIYRDADQEKYRECLDLLSVLNERIEAIIGVKDNFQEDSSILEQSGMQGFCGAISIKEEGMVHTGKLMQSLMSKAIGMGVLILNGIEVIQIGSKTRIEDDGSQFSLKDRPRSSSSILECIQTSYGTIQAKKVAVCTNGIASQLLTLREPQGAKLVKPARAQVVVTSPIDNLPFRGTFHLDEGYYYFRNVGDRVLFGGGRNMDFEAEETDELNTSDQIINHLSSLLETHILPHHAFTIDYHWAGTMGVGESKSPILEQLSENLYCGVRLGGMGVAIGSLVGKELAEMMSR